MGYASKRKEKPVPISALSAQVELDDLRAHRLGEQLLCRPARLPAHPLAQRRVFFEKKQYLKCLPLALEQKPVPAVIDYLGVAPAIMAHHRQPAGHRFCDHSPRRFEELLGGAVEKAVEPLQEQVRLLGIRRQQIYRLYAA